MASTAARPQVIRKIRHWKQRFDPKARMVWRKRVRWPNRDGKGLMTFEPGDVVPAWVIKSMNGNKLRNLWEAGRIELLGFEAPNVRTGVVDPPPEPQAEAPKTPEPAPKKKSTRRKKASAKPAAERTA
jgi:hypothetical protein